MAINGTVQATGEFAPTSTGDTYAIIDARYMRDGFRNVDTLADLDNITEDRRIAGMVVGVSGGTDYYKLNQEPWLFDFTDWSVFNTGGGISPYVYSGATGIQPALGGNNASGTYTTIAGGGFNIASGSYAFIGGGGSNSVTSVNGVIGGGNQNVVSGDYSFIGSGRLNLVTNNESAIVGGIDNRILAGYRAFIGGGAHNTISGNTYNVIVGGLYNLNNGYVSSIVGGNNNTILNGGSKSFIGGGFYNTINGYGSIIVGGTQNSVTGNYSAIGGGLGNTTSGNYSSIAGGTRNLASGIGSFIGGGGFYAGYSGTYGNSATTQNSAIVGGYKNIISGGAYAAHSFIGGGGYNSISTLQSVILGGKHSSIQGGGYYSAIIGGRNHTINNGYYSAIIGGLNNYASGNAVVIGGNNISGTSNNTVYVPTLNLNNVPDNDNALTQVLVRAADGTVKYKAASSFTFTGNTSASCISDLYVTDIYGCSPVTINGSTTGSGNHTFKVRNQTTELISVRDDGYTEFTKNGAESVFGTSSNYLNHIGNRLVQFSNSATYTGFHADRNGSGISMRATSANDISLIESTGTMTFSTGWDNNFNTSGTLAMLINGDNRRVGIGLPTNLTIPDATLHVRSTGTTTNTSAQIWQNGTPTELARITDDGGLCIGINTLAGGFANAARLRVDVTTSADYTNTVVFDQTYNNTSNNSNTANTFVSRIYKSSAFNLGYLHSSYYQTRNDGTGSINYMYGTESQIYNIGNANITNAFAYSARVQYQAGNISLLGGLDVSYQENLSGTISNMIGVLVRTPVNVTSPTVTNTYGVLLQANTLGANDYGFYQQGADTINHYAGKSGFNITAPTALVHAKATGDTFTGIAFKVEGATVDNLLTIKDNGRIGVNVAPNSGDRIYITAGSGLDGAINISSTNLANNGYAILAQGGTSSSNYNGIWSDVTGGGTGIGRSFYGNSGINGYSQNYGGYFSARNGSTYSVGVYGSANGGDAVTPSDFVAGVWGNVGATLADDRRAIYANISQSTNIENANSYGMRFEVSYVSTVSAETVYGIYSDASAVGSGVTNVSGYFKATNVSNNENYAIITDGGDSGFGTLTPTDMLHVNGVTGSTQFRLEQSYTPTGSGDTAGNIGSVAWDDDYWYQKTNTGWGRIAWSYAF